jgi:hypothetical protein
VLIVVVLAGLAVCAGQQTTHASEQAAIRKTADEAADAFRREAQAAGRDDDVP